MKKIELKSLTQVKGGCDDRGLACAFSIALLFTGSPWAFVPIALTCLCDGDAG